MRLKTALLLALTCVLTLGVYAQNQNFYAYGSLTASGSGCTEGTNCTRLTFPSKAVGIATAQLAGTFVGTSVFEGSPDFGTTWTSIQGSPLPSGATASSATATGLWQFSVGGMTDLRVRVSAFTSGTIGVFINSSQASGVPASGVVPVTPGTASATTQGGAPIICDSATSGSVTAGQAEMVRCDINGRLVVVSPSADGDALNNSAAAFWKGGTDQTLYTIPVFNHLFGGGTTWPRWYSTSLTNLVPATTTTARNEVGAGLIEKGSRWSVFSNPAAGSQATASIAAEASVRHVADCVSFSGGSVVAPVLTALTVNLRDGATGAGTVIWTQQVIISAATGQNVAPFTACGLNLTGTTNTAMTLEFSAALASLSESATITGFNVN